MKRKLLKYRPAPGTDSKDLGPPIWVVLVTVFIFFVSQLVIAPLIIWLGANIVHPGAPIDLNSTLVQFFFLLIAEGSLIVSVLYILKNRRLSLRIIGLGRRLKASDPLWAALGFAGFFILLIIAGKLIDVFAPGITNQQQEVGFNNINTGLDRNLALVSLVILPPLGEEILMRGYLFSGLRKYWRFWPAALVTSVIFGAAHLSEANSGLLWTGAIDTFLLSVVLCGLRQRTGALYAGIMVHMLNNLIAFGVHFK